MTENLLIDTGPIEVADCADINDESPVHREYPEENSKTIPTGIPEKFWNEDKNELRTDELLKSYIELERKLGMPKEKSLPSTAEDYQIAVENELLSSDPEVNRRLHAAGLTQDQAQLVYDLASERLIPLITEVASLYEAEAQTGQLIRHFGGEARWRETARQLEAWGQSRLPKSVFEALSTTFDGVLAMHRMMSGGEPGLIRPVPESVGPLNEEQLRKLMREPKYWRDQDPVTVEKIRSGFRNLYGD